MTATTVKPKVGRGTHRSTMDDPEVRERFAELYSRGLLLKEIAEEMGVNRHTITEWKKHPKAQATIQRLQQERAQNILRRVDTALERKLESADDLTTDELIRIRKELLPQQIELTQKSDTAPALQGLLQRYLEDPEATLAELAGELATDDQE